MHRHGMVAGVPPTERDAVDVGCAASSASLYVVKHHCAATYLGFFVLCSAEILPFSASVGLSLICPTRSRWQAAASRVRPRLL